LLEGKNVNLRIWEKEDLKLVMEWTNNPDFFGEFVQFMQMSRPELEKFYDRTRAPSTPASTGDFQSFTGSLGSLRARLTPQTVP
jgi:hypothetical protein